MYTYTQLLIGTRECIQREDKLRHREYYDGALIVFFCTFKLYVDGNDGNVTNIKIVVGRIETSKKSENNALYNIEANI